MAVSIASAARCAFVAGIVAGVINGHGAAAAPVTVHVQRADGSAAAGAVVALADGDDHGDEDGAGPTRHVVDQVNKRFVPRVIAIRPGDAVHFPNSDDIRHHVYSFSSPRVFELPLYSGEPAEPVVFDKPGKVVLGCNIHDRMRGYVYVLPADFLAVTTDGAAHFATVPAGHYRLEVHHPDQPASGALTRSLLVGADAASAVTVTLPETAPPQQAGEPERELSPVEKRFLELRRNAGD